MMTHHEIEVAIERLGAVDFDGTDSHGRWTRICAALYQPEFGWTLGECDGLRAVLVDLLRQADPDTHMELPMDEDGVPWHIGDVTDSIHNELLTVKSISPDSLVCTDKCGCSHTILPPHAYRHHHEPTIEDVLAEMLDTWDALPTNASNEAIIAEYADRLREVMADE